MSLVPDDEIPCKRARLANNDSDGMNQDESNTEDADGREPRNLSLYFRINEEPPFRLNGLELQNYVKLKHNDEFTEKHIKQLIADRMICFPSNDVVVDLWRSIDDVDYTVVKLSTDEQFVEPVGLEDLGNVQHEAAALTTSQNLSLDDQQTSSNEPPGIPTDDELDIECTKRACLDGEYFRVKKELSKVDGTIIAVCMFCKPEKTIKASLRCTSNLTTHLRKLHPDEFEQYQEYSLAKKAASNNPVIDRKRWSCTFSQQLFESNVTNYVLKSMVPLSTVENESFRRLFDDSHIKKGNNSLEHMSRHTLTAKITETTQQQMADIRACLAKVDYVCTTADAWSGRNRRFLGVTVHWIDEKTFARKSAAIACKRFPGTHSHEAIASYLTEINDSFHLTPEKIVATVTDNGSNFVKAFKEYGVDTSGEFFFTTVTDNLQTDGTSEARIVNELLSDDTANVDANFAEECRKLLPQHLRCASHTLNLISTTDSIKAIDRSKDLAEVHSSVLEKCTSLWKSLRSPKMNEAMKNYLGSALRRPVVTRWNSLFDALRQLLTFKEKLLQNFDGDNGGITLRDPFSKSDFRYLEEYLSCTEPLAKAIDRLQGEKYCHYGFLLPTLLDLRRKLFLLQDNRDVKLCQPLVKAMIQALETRFKHMFDVSEEGIAAAIAAVSHPQFKIRWLQCMSIEKQKVIYNAVVDAISAGSGQEKSTDKDRVDPDDDFDFGDGASAFQDLEVCSNHAAAEMEVTRYLKDPARQLTMLKEYPLVKKLFHKFNTPLPSSAPVERLFSYATMIDLPKYNRLTDQHFEERILGAANASKDFL